MIARYPGFGDVVYVDRSAELFADDGHWRVEAACVPAFTSQTGPHANTHRRLVARDDLFAVAEIRHAYHCALLARPGVPLAAIERVLGHTGSINQSRPWLEAHVPAAQIVIVDSHSLGAAREVLAGGGDTAAVGSVDLAADTGLEILARDIDGGSIGLYWALSATPAAPQHVTRVVVVGRTQDGRGLTAVVNRLSRAGFSLVALNQITIGDRLFHSGCVAFFEGVGELDEVRSAVLPAEGLRLAGSYATSEVQ
jgi:prephenate dehydratase